MLSTALRLFERLFYNGQHDRRTVAPPRFSAPENLCPKHAKLDPSSRRRSRPLLSGDYARAEQLLREAAELQEADLGPMHPDVANTLNNLGVVCEITGKPVDAEHFFRRACAIATALQPDHPFVHPKRPREQ